MYGDLSDNVNNHQEGVSNYEVIKSTIYFTIVILVGDTAVGKTSLLTK
jgi:hypothetical protein